MQSVVDHSTATELEKMKAGQYFLPGDPEICSFRRKCQQLLTQIRAAEDLQDAQMVQDLQRKLFGSMGEGTVVNTGLRCDFGFNVTLGSHIFLNYDCVLLDVGPLSIGDHTLVGPGVHFYAVAHPLFAHERREPRNCKAGKIVVGKDCWIGGGSKIMSGVTIGDGAVIGAGSIVSKDVPANTLVAGSPAKFLRHIFSHEEVNQAISDIVGTEL